MKLVFSKRGGKRVSEAAVLRSRDATAASYEAGRWPRPWPPDPSPAPRLAAAIRRMSAAEYARWSGAFTYNVKPEGVRRVAQ